jgi:hypothetical protein
MEGVRGAFPGRTYLHFIRPDGLSSGEQDAVDDAFERWEYANQVVTGLGSGFTRTFDPTQRHVLVLKTDAGVDNSGNPIGASIAITRDSTPGGSYSDSATLILTTRTINNTPIMSGPEAHRRFTLHELGHFHALADAAGAPAGSTVMREPVSINAPEIPNNVTSCDAWKAWETQF